MALAMKDSKRGITSEAADEVSDVLLHRLGEVVPTKASMLSKFPSRYVTEWLADMGFPSEQGEKIKVDQAEAKLGLTHGKDAQWMERECQKTALAA
mmetsp:Transcript_76509/g.185184  ORF Transcript_76509/g.185184 Transcript_76509/m.185184 type:complete len:96 (-) Transcript_76509:95-382(-)